jgi:hypothetical protein
MPPSIFLQMKRKITTPVRSPELHHFLDTGGGPSTILFSIALFGTAVTCLPRILNTEDMTSGQRNFILTLRIVTHP